MYRRPQRDLFGRSLRQKMGTSRNEADGESKKIPLQNLKMVGKISARNKAMDPDGQCQRSEGQNLRGVAIVSAFSFWRLTLQVLHSSLRVAFFAFRWIYDYIWPAVKGEFLG